MAPAPGTSKRFPHRDRSAIGLLRLLMAGCLLLPLLLFVVASWLNYRTAIADAFRSMEHSADVAREHAAKVFDGQSQVADRVTDLLRGLTPGDVVEAEQRLHDAFASIVIRLPQVQGVLLVGTGGMPLASAGVYPVPRDISLRSFDYYRAVVQRSELQFVTEVQIGTVSNTEFFGLAHPWKGPDGTVLGVIDVSASPALYQQFYAALAGEGRNDMAGTTIALIREDGQLLVHYPPRPGPLPRAPADGPLMRAIAANPEAGTYEATAINKALGVRYFAYRKVQGFPVYVVADSSRAVVMAGWYRTVGSHLIFGIPATLALVAITWTALVRTRREEVALNRARDEMVRREQAEEALLRSQRLEAVGQMTGGVAHDFNNLLTVILGSAEMLARRPDDPARVRRLAEQIMLAARRGGDVTQQLLAFSRRQFVNPQTLDLNACLQEFRPLLERASNESIRVDYALQADLKPALLDPGHLEAAVLNLVGNARDAMPDGGTITITTRTVTRAEASGLDLPPGGYVRVGVTDTGSGMDPQTAAKAFEPFFTTKGIGQGTGLGLSQVYGFAKQAGGDARIVTAPGKGTTVELFLPQSAPVDEQPRPEPAQARKADPGEVVLVVEDDPGVLATTVESLQDLGYGTVTASSARDALARLGVPARIDVLFSDVTMPGGMDGVALSAEAQRLRPGLKVLLTSGYGAGQDRLVDVPMLTKPYDRTQLAEELRAVLQR